MKKLFQFLIGKVQRDSVEERVFFMPNKRFQFLIGKVQQPILRLLINRILSFSLVINSFLSKKSVDLLFLNRKFPAILAYFKGFLIICYFTP